MPTYKCKKTFGLTNIKRLLYYLKLVFMVVHSRSQFLSLQSKNVVLFLSDFEQKELSFEFLNENSGDENLFLFLPVPFFFSN